MLDGWGVYHPTLDPRDGTLFAATNHRVYGSTIQRSADTGRTWTRSNQIGLPEESGLTLDAAWHIEPGRPEEEDTSISGPPRACSFAPTMVARPGRSTAAFSNTPRGSAGSQAPEGCAATRSSSTRATLCIGQETVPVAVSSILEESDRVAGTYRGHGHALAVGVGVIELFGEMLGRRTGISGGRGGSMNVTSLEHRYLGTYGVGCKPSRISGIFAPRHYGHHLGRGRVHGRVAEHPHPFAGKAVADLPSALRVVDEASRQLERLSVDLPPKE